MYQEIQIDEFLGQIESDEKTLCDVLNLPESFRTDIIEKLDPARTYKINSPKERKVLFQGKARVIKKGIHEYPLNFALWLLSKFGVGSDKTYGVTKFADLNCDESEIKLPGRPRKEDKE